MTTPISLPITPEEPLSATSLPGPAHTYTPGPAYSTPFYKHAPSTPLTPESLVSPESFCNSDEVDEVLSYLSSDSTTPQGNDAFNVFPSPNSGTDFGTSIGYNDSCKLK